MELQKRKQIRLNEYNYSSAGAYFITICTHNREMLFGNIVANCVRPNEPIPLTNIRIIINNEIQKLCNTYDNVFVDKYVIMPNHIHLIIKIVSDSNGRLQFAPTISRIIKQFKGSITKSVGFSIWQRSYHDRIIRNELEYQKIWEYIDTNPLKWEQDCLNPNTSNRKEP